MRLARAADHWRRAFRRPYDVRCTEISYENLLGLGNGTAGFTGGISAIVGGNGVGKSTLVAAAAELFGGKAALDELDHEIRLRGSTIRGVVVSNETEFRVSVVPKGGERQVEGALPEHFQFAWLDPAYQTAKTRGLIAQDPNFAEVLEPIGPRKFSEEELDTLRYVVGKDYESCEVFEVPEYGKIEQFPYFKVQANGVVYGSETMGQGELSLMFMMWELLTLPRNSVLLLEEPETHVSPRSQEALMNELARAADERGVWTVVTTHSPVVISKVPIEHVRLLARNGGNVVMVPSPARYMVAAVLGGDYGFRGAALVEDVVAKLFIISLLEEKDPDLLRQFEIVDSKSNAGIASALRSMPKTRPWFSLIGVFDGDQRDRIDAREFGWPHTFLPGTSSPERLLLDVFRQSDPTRLAADFGCSKDTVVATHGAIAGKDHHDQLRQAAELLGVGLERAIRHLVVLWLSSDDRTEMCKEFLEALRNAK